MLRYVGLQSREETYVHRSARHNGTCEYAPTTLKHVAVNKDWCIMKYLFERIGVTGAFLWDGSMGR